MKEERREENQKIQWKEGPKLVKLNGADQVDGTDEYHVKPEDA